MSTISIPLKSSKYPGLFALIDESDLPLIEGISWSVLVCGGRPRYAVHRFQRRAVLMHRIILGLNDGDSEVDHFDGDGFNNTRGNLRLASKSQNMANRPAFSNSKSGVKGVSWKSSLSKWCAQIQVNGKKIHIGYFSNIEDAAHAYEIAAQELHGEFASHA